MFLTRPRGIKRLLLITAIGLFAGDVKAQSGSHAPSPFFASAAIGAGESGPAQSLGHDRRAGPTFALGLGAALTARGIIDVTWTHWQGTIDAQTSRTDFVNVSATAFIFDRFLSNIYMRAGVGVGSGSYPRSVVTVDTSTLRITRPSLNLGTGIDLPLHCPYWITPYAEALNTLGGHRSTQIRAGEGTANAVLFYFGLAIKRYHTGKTGCGRTSIANLP